MRILLCAGIVLSVFFSTNTFARSTIERKGTIVEVRTPLNDLTSSKKKQVLRLSIAQLLEELKKRVPGSEFQNENDYIDNVRNAYFLLDESLLAKLTSGFAKVDANLFQLDDLLPSAIGINIAIRAGAGAGVSAAASAGVMLIAVPLVIHRVDIITKRVTSQITFDLALKAVPDKSFGAGVGGGAGARVGLVLIWGPASSAAEISGVFAGGSHTFVSGPLGVNVRYGVIQGNGKLFPYAGLSWAGGMELTAEPFHGVAGVMVGLDRLLGVDIGSLTLSSPWQMSTDELRRELEGERAKDPSLGY